jgi:hypothetical protein
VASCTTEAPPPPAAAEATKALPSLGDAGADAGCNDEGLHLQKDRQQRGPAARHPVADVVQEILRNVSSGVVVWMKNAALGSAFAAPHLLLLNHKTCQMGGVLLLLQ